MDVAAIVLAVLVGALVGHLVTAWLLHRSYWLFPKNRTFKSGDV
jgi:hypothetical protein